MLVGSVERARAALGWTPERSSLEQQIRDALSWLQTSKILR
jgi:UDP-glucose 4-epimerase